MQPSGGTDKPVNMPSKNDATRTSAALPSRYPQLPCWAAPTASPKEHQKTGVLSPRYSAQHFMLPCTGTDTLSLFGTLQGSAGARNCSSHVQRKRGVGPSLRRRWASAWATKDSDSADRPASGVGPGTCNKPRLHVLQEEGKARHGELPAYVGS